MRKPGVLSICGLCKKDIHPSESGKIQIRHREKGKDKDKLVGSFHPECFIEFCRRTK